MKKKVIFLAGHKGMTGSAVYRLLKKNKKKYKTIVRTRKQLDLVNQKKVYSFFKK